jgi:hypothetical protein
MENKQHFSLRIQQKTLSFPTSVNIWTASVDLWMFLSLKHVASISQAISHSHQHSGALYFPTALYLHVSLLFISQVHIATLLKRSISMSCQIHWYLSQTHQLFSWHPNRSSHVT